MKPSEQIRWCSNEIFSTFSSEKLMTLKDEKISLQSSLLDLGVGGKVAIIRRMLLGIYPKIVIDLKTNSKSLKGLTYFCYSKTFSDKKNTKYSLYRLFCSPIL